MSASIENGASIADRARLLYTQRAYRKLAELLEPFPRADLLAQPQLGFWLADTWRRLGRTRDALELAVACAASCQYSGIHRLEQDRLNLEGMLRYESGDLWGAESAWRELLARASESCDQEFLARANNNLGIIYTLQARPLEAATCYERAVAAYRQAGVRRGIAQSHQNLAITYREIGNAEEADEHFSAALRYAWDDGSEDEIARAEQERALLIYYSRNDARLARATVKRALLRFSRIADPLGFADALRALAMIELGEKELAPAHRHAEHALEHARKAGHRLLEAELLEVLAGIALAERSTAIAVQARREAAILFQLLQAPAWGAKFRERIEALAIGRRS
jgi:tetratricopeptide (TPR) repeat protein